MPELAPTPPHVEIDRGHRLFVRDWGDGPPVLLLSGWAMDSAIWGAVMTRLNGLGLRAIAYDRRGHGRSTDPGRIDEAALVADLTRVIDSLDLNGLTLVAHSGSSVEALGYLARHGRKRIARLILVGATGPYMCAGPDNPYGFPPEAVAEVLRRLDIDLPAWIDENAEPFAPGATRRTLDWLAAMVMNTGHRTLVDLQALIAHADLREAAAALDLPVTLLHGDLDVSAPLEITGRRYAQLIPGAELVVYNGVAHGVMVTHAQRLAEDIAARARGA